MRGKPVEQKKGLPIVKSKVRGWAQAAHAGAQLAKNVGIGPVGRSAAGDGSVWHGKCNLFSPWKGVVRDRRAFVASHGMRDLQGGRRQYQGARFVMTLTGFLLLLLVAAVCGSIAQALVGYSHGGCLVSAALGLIGAMIGVWLAQMLKLPYGIAIKIDGQEFPIVWSILGASLFVAVLSLLAYRRAPRL